jgi:hypothetical protein
MLFQPFKKATRPETPGFAVAEARQGQLNQQAKQQENALRSQNMIGAGELYNAGMGDRSPIADSIFGETPVTEGATAETSGALEAVGTESPLIAPAAEGAGAAVPGLAPGVAPTALGSSAAGGVGAGGLAPALAAPAATAATGAATAAVPAAAAGAGMAPALAALGPAGWAALAGMALMG